MDTSKVRKPPPLGGVFFPMFLAVFWAEAAVGGGMLKLHHSEVVQFQDTPYYWCSGRIPPTTVAAVDGHLYGIPQRGPGSHLED